MKFTIRNSQFKNKIQAKIKTKNNPPALKRSLSDLWRKRAGLYNLFNGALCILALFLIAIYLLPVPQNSYAQSVDDIQRQKNSLNPTINNLNNNIKTKQGEARTLSGEIAIFDNQIYSFQSQINSTQSQISSINSQIDDANKKIVEAEVNIKVKKESLDEYLRVMYEDSNISTIELIVASNSFSDFVDKTEYNLTMQEKIKIAVAEIKGLKKELENKKVELTAKGQEIEGLKKQQISQRQQVDAQKAAKDRLLSTTKGQEAGYKTSLKQEQQKQAQLDSQIQSILVAQAAQNAPGTSGGGGSVTPPPSQSGYSWPYVGYSRGMLVPGVNYIPYGDTVYYFPGISHTGIDIYGGSIMSASSGVVSFAGNCGGYGTCAMISNGNHLVIYGHMNSTALSTGQAVSAGQYVGQQGSTGWSTGPHLHFEIRVGGYAVNPLNYLP